MICKGRYAINPNDLTKPKSVSEHFFLTVLCVEGGIRWSNRSVCKLYAFNGNTGCHIIVSKFVFDRNRYFTIVNELIVLDRNTWNHITVNYLYK